MKTRENCGRVIGNFETPETYSGRTFCVECKKHLESINTPTPSSNQPVKAGGGKATASLVLGIIGMLAWILPILGFPITITGLVLGIKSLESPRRGTAIAGVVLNTIALVLTTANSAIGAYLGATGHLKF
ncbi:MAG TPA: DUF4190 domain-containing protein [Phycisphaerae bacterium]|nr:DUF4190 domain-containing protein [Phycisphaerae bacterium]